MTGNSDSSSCPIKPIQPTPTGSLIERSHACHANIPIILIYSRISKRDIRLCSSLSTDHLCCFSVTSTLVVLGSQVLDKLDVLLLGIGRAQVLEFGPLVVLRLALESRQVSRHSLFFGILQRTLKSKAPALGASSNLGSWLPCLNRA